MWLPFARFTKTLGRAGQASKTGLTACDGMSPSHAVNIDGTVTLSAAVTESGDRNQEWDESIAWRL